MNFKSQICTTREQSERLLTLGLKKETADCNLSNFSLKGKGYQNDWQVGTTPYSDCLESWSAFAKDSCWELIPAWSLNRLLCLYGADYTIKEVYNNAEECYGMLICAIEIAIEEGDFNQEYLEKQWE